VSLFSVEEFSVTVFSGRVQCHRFQKKGLVLLFSVEKLALLFSEEEFSALVVGGIVQNYCFQWKSSLLLFSIVQHT
jgi:hypothetical protein